MSLQVGAHEQRVFATGAVGIAGEPTDAGQLSAVLRQRNEGYVAVIVELREPLQHLVGKTLAWRQKTKPDVAGRHLCEKVGVERDVGRLDRSYAVVRAAARKFLLPFRRIGTDRERRVRPLLFDNIRIDLNARIESYNALRIGKQRIDVHRHDAGEIDNHLRQAVER